MRRMLLLIAAVGMFLVVLAPVAQAELCAKCSQNMYIMSIGQCKACQGPTSSGSHAICRKCSAKTGQCEHCLASLRPNNPYAKPKPGQVPPTQVKPGQVVPGQVPPTQVIPGQAPPTQVIPGQVPPTQVIPGQVPPTQVIPGQVPPTQVIPGQVPPTQVIPGQVPPTQPIMMKPVIVTDKANGQTIGLAPGQMLLVQLKANATTGFSWQLVGFGSKDKPWLANPKLDTILVQAAEKKYVPDPPPQGMVGSGGTCILTFKAMGPGKREILAEYLQPWNTKEKPARVFKVTVQVGTGHLTNKPGQVPPTQVIPGQTPPTQVIPGQTPPIQVIPGQIPATPLIPGQTPPTQVIPGQVPPTQVIPGQVPPTPVIPGQTPPTQVIPGQIPSTPLVPGQAPPIQGNPGQVIPPAQNPVGGF